MDRNQIKLTFEKFPVLFNFARQYKENDPNDIRTSFRDSPVLLIGEEFWQYYEQALQTLSHEDKDFLLKKLGTTTKKLSEERGWAHFEEILNEVLAHKMLSDDNFGRVVFIDDSKEQGLTPDLKILVNGNILYGLSEVKTIRFSDDEYKVVSEELRTGKGRFLSAEVHPTLEKKIIEEVKEAVNQIWTYYSTELSIKRVYLFLNLDQGNYIDLIFTPQSDLEQFLCSLRIDTENGTIQNLENKKVQLKIYILAGRKPVELKCE